MIGEKANRYWLAYLSEDADGKRELEIGLSLLVAKLLGNDVQDQEVPLSSPPSSVAAGPYPLGNIYYGQKLLHSFGIQEDEWIQHTAIFGRSGAGKTNTVVVVIEDLLEHKKPFLIFDWKRNYRDLIPKHKDKILAYTIGRQTVPFAFNPLIPPEGTDASVWLKKLIEIIAHSYYLGEGVMFLLQEAIHSAYKEFKVYTSTQEQYPTFQHVYRWLEDHPAKGRKALWMDSALRGVKSICFGNMGKVVNTAVQPNLASLLEKNVILELDSLTNADKTFIIESLLLWIHHYRLAQPHRETFKHALIIEEAHHILLKRTGGQGGEAITDTIIREIRELGEAIVLVDQHPSLISVPALGNTYTTIAMNLKHKSDVSAVGAAMLLDEDQRDILGKLPVGMAVVKLQGRWLHPFVIKIPHRNIRKGSVDDKTLSHLMKDQLLLQPDTQIKNQRDQSSSSSQVNQNKPLSPHLQPQTPFTEQIQSLPENETKLLKSVLEHPFLGTVERYRLLGVSRRKGNALRESCISKALVRTVDIPTRSGRVVLLDLTRDGKHVLKEHGYSIPTKDRWGSLEHEYWKHKAAGNGFTDIVAEKDNQKIAIEIETGKSDWKANFKKNIKNGYSCIWILATNDSAFHSIAAGVSELSIQGSFHIEKVQGFVTHKYPLETQPKQN